MTYALCKSSFLFELQIIAASNQNQLCALASNFSHVFFVRDIYRKILRLVGLTFPYKQKFVYFLLREMFIEWLTMAMSVNE